MNDVRARFLKSILEQIPAERIAELHFFTPIRQGQIETGVAVIAAEPERPLPVAEVVAEVVEAVGTDAAVDVVAEVSAAAASDDAVDMAGDVEFSSGVDASDDAELGDDDDVAVEAAAEADDDSPYADAPVAVTEPVASPDEPAERDDITVVAAGSPPQRDPATRRFEIITAAYRWTRKGPERGKWEVDVTTEADAPLPIAGTVVLGVHQRAGEELEPLRLTNAELQALLSEPAWQTTP